MKIPFRIYILLIVWMCTLLFYGTSRAFEGGEKKNPSQPQQVTLQEYKLFDVNTISCSINSAGPFCTLSTGAPGLEWPKGSRKFAATIAGLWVIGIHRPSHAIRTAVQYYSGLNEFQPGPILGTFNTATNKPTIGVDIGDPADQRYHIYKVARSDSLGGNPDYNGWPHDFGAPYVDVDKNGKWTPGVDKPKLWGDQQLWCVWNDANPSNHTRVGTSSPMGIEVQATYFGFNKAGALGNTMFVRWKIINKSDADYDGVNISLFSDSNLGDANDNFAGVDVPRNLSYVYNSTNNDRTYGTPPPADGFVLLQGPRIANPDSTSLFEGARVKGYYNIPITAHTIELGSNDPRYTGPFQGTLLFPDQAYGYQNGLISNTQQPYIDTTTGNPTTFVMAGDPVTGTGWTMNKSFPTGRFVVSTLSSGTFTLARGDTQEIVGAFVIGQGTDRLNSITVLRRYVDVVRDVFNANFLPPDPPPAPTVAVGDLSNKIVLNWGDPSSYALSENFSLMGGAKSYRFEGYNIYQLANPNAGTSNYVRVATFDIAGDNIKTELDDVTDPATGLIVHVPVCFGSDAGIKRNFVVDKDYLTNGPLVNGKEYYFAVTSYAYNFDPFGASSGVPKVLEGVKIPLTVIPRGLSAGEVLGGSINQRILTDRGMYGDDGVIVTLINPKQLTGALYEVSFNGVGDVVKSWNVKRKGAGSDVELLNAYTDLTGAEPLPSFDGLTFKATQSDIGVRADTKSPKGYLYTPSGNIWFEGQKSGNTMQAFAGGITYPTISTFIGKGTKVKPSQVKKVEIRFSTTKTQKAYRYVDNISTIPPRPIYDPSFTPYILHNGGGFVYQDFVDVPFTVWEVDSTDGNLAARQLNTAFVERNDSLYHADGSFYGLGKVDGKWLPTTATNGGREFLYIFASDYNSAPLSQYTKDPTDTTKWMNISGYQDSTDLMYVLYLKALDSTKTFTEGDKFLISPSYPISPSTIFSVQAPKNVSGDPQLIKNTIERINVFPNPYFANNLAESSVYDRWVTFSNLPDKATLRIFTLSGERIATIVHNNTTGFERWNLRNDSGISVASGMYIVNIKIAGAGTKILKLAVIQPQEHP